MLFLKTERGNASRISSGRHGFTLLEVAIAVMLMAMLAAVAAVHVRGYYTQQQLEYAARQVQLRIKGLRQKAMRDERTCQLRVDWKNSRLLWSMMKEEPTSTDESSENASWSDYETLYELSEPVSFLKNSSETSENNSEAVYFFPDGRCTAATYELRHNKSGEIRWVILTDWSGEVSLQQ